MTTAELKELAFLPAEIAYTDRQIKSLKSPPYLQDMDTAQRAACAAALTELTELYREHREKSAALLEKLQRFMDSIDDPFTHELFQLRYGRALEWAEVNLILTKRGFWYEDSSLRMICRRYTERYNRNEQNQNRKRTAAAAV